jgi:hypothetical protein
MPNKAHPYVFMSPSYATRHKKPRRQFSCVSQNQGKNKILVELGRNEAKETILSIQTIAATIKYSSLGQFSASYCLSLDSM